MSARNEIDHNHLLPLDKGEWFYVGDGVYGAIDSGSKDVELICYDGMEIYERIFIEQRDFKRLIEKFNAA